MKLFPLLVLILSASICIAQRDAGRHKLIPVEVDAFTLDEPPFEYTLDAEALELITLDLLSTVDNRVTDYDQWFWSHYYPAETYHNGGVNDAIRGTVPPPEVPRTIDVKGDTLHLWQVIYGMEAMIASYGLPPNRFGVVLDPRVMISFRYESGPAEWALDFSRWAYGPVSDVDPLFLTQSVRWAEESAGILYVSCYHRTYAESSGYQNGYITAIDLASMEVLWRSEPLVCNSANFLVVGDTIVSGYGFTDEDDYVYLLDRITGEAYDRIRMRTAPEYFVLEGDTLYVRCYDVDCELLVSRLGP